MKIKKAKQLNNDFYYYLVELGNKHSRERNRLDLYSPELTDEKLKAYIDHLQGVSDILKVFLEFKKEKGDLWTDKPDGRRG